jgi:hypothetical protein
MTSASDFSASLVECGFATDAATAIQGEGLKSIKEFAATFASDIDELMKHMNKNKPEGVTFPMLATKKLQPYKFFVDYRTNTGQTATADLWVEPTLTQWCTKYSVVLATVEGETRDKASCIPL